MALLWRCSGSPSGISDLDDREKEHFGRSLFGEIYYHPLFGECERNIWFGVDQTIES